MLHYAILNPYWNIPTDLAKTNVAPKVLSGRTLQSMGMEALSDWTDKATVLDPAKIDWPAVAAGMQELRVRQLPGPANSMGSSWPPRTTLGSTSAEASGASGEGRPSAIWGEVRPRPVR